MQVCASVPFASRIGGRRPVKSFRSVVKRASFLPSTRHSDSPLQLTALTLSDAEEGSGSAQSLPPVRVTPTLSSPPATQVPSKLAGQSIALNLPTSLRRRKSEPA